MIDTANQRGCAPDTAGMNQTHYGLHIFADGCFEPGSGQGGWSFVAYRDAAEIASDCGGIRDSANNAMELIALLKAAIWVNDNAMDEPAVIWSDSHYAVKGCNSWRQIWKNSGWRKKDPGTRSRSRIVANHELWKAIDLQLSQNQLLTIAWCKGHCGIPGNERADALADIGRLTLNNDSPCDDAAIPWASARYPTSDIRLETDRQDPASVVWCPSPRHALK